MVGFELREAMPQDADAVADYHRRCFEKTYAAQLLAGELEPPDQASTRQQQHDRFLPGSGFETIVAVVDDTPIAHVTISGHYVVHLFVDPDHQHAGLGSHLLALAEEMLAARGYSNFELHTRVDNHPAVGFYERAGWTVTDQVIHTVEHGIGYDELVLTKPAASLSERHQG